MSHHVKVLSTCLGAAIVLMTAVSVASANRLLVSNKEMRIVWRPLTVETIGEAVRCDVTLEAEFHSTTIHKVSPALVGNVTRASVSNCTEGTATMLTETLPWHVTYKGFEGSLPRPTLVSFSVINASFRVDPPGLPACLGRTTTTNPATGEFLIEPNGLVTSLAADASAQIPLSGGFGCGLFQGRFLGTARVTNLSGTQNIAIRLI